MRYALALLAAVAAVPATAATRDFPASGFERVQLDAVGDVAIRSGGGFSIHADGDDEAVARLTATVKGDTLYLGWKSGSSTIRDSHLRIAITMPRVSGAGVKGVGHVAVDRADAPLTVFAVQGTGSLAVGAVRSDKTVLSLSGTGSIEAAGATGHLDARRSGVGSIEAGKLQAKSAVLMSSGIGSLEARVDGPATVTQSGIGSVTVLGHPSCTVHKSGLGSVDCAGGRNEG